MKLKSIGSEGNSSGIREVNGSVHDAQNLFNQQIDSFTVREVSPGVYVGQGYDGNVYTFRPTSSEISRYVPTIDINTISGLRKIKFIDDLLERDKMRKKELLDYVFLTNRGIKYPKFNLDKGYCILYPTDGYYINEIQYDCLVEVLNNTDRLNDVFNVDIENIINEFDLQNGRLIKKFDYKIYKSKMLLLENSIVDINLNWSISVYQDYWGILYADNVILEEFSKKYNIATDIQLFAYEIVSNIRDEKVKNDYQQLIEKSYF